MPRPAVALRRANEHDAVLFSAIRKEPSAARYQPLRPYSGERLRSLLRQRAARPLDQTLDAKVQWVILADDEAVGWITLDATSREHAIGSVGYTIRERDRGRGIAQAALNELVTLAFDPCGPALERVEAVVATANLASRRVLEGQASVGREPRGDCSGSPVTASIMSVTGCSATTG